MSTISAAPHPAGHLARVSRACARRAARRPRTVLALWLLFAVACTFAGSFTGTRTLSDAAMNVGPAARAAATLQRAGLTPPAHEQILVRSESPRRTAAATAAFAAHARHLAAVAAVTTPAPTTDGGRSALLGVSLRGDPDTHIGALVQLVRRMRTELPGVTLQETGDASTQNAVSGLVSRGLAHAGMVAVPLTLLILALVFGALAAASVPLLLGVTSVVAALGALGLISQIAPQGTSTVPVVTLIGLAVGVDYSLFAIRRWRAERRAGAALEAALDATAATVGRAILVAGATVVIGLAGLLLSGFAVFTSMALGAIEVVAITVIGSLTALPAALTLLGDRLDAGRLRLPRHATRATRCSPWERIAATVTGHPRVALGAALLTLLALAAPVVSMRIAADGDSALPANLPAVRAADAVAHAFPGASDIETLVVSGRALGGPAARVALDRLGAEGRARVHGHGPVGIRVSRTGAVAAVRIPVPSADLRQADGNVRRLRDVLPAMTVRLLPGAQATLTGDDAENVDFSRQLSAVTPVVIGVVLALAFALLVACFGSPWLALTVIALNLLSVGAAFGVLVAVFQHTWAQSLLHFTSDGAIVSWLPLFAFVVLFGLSMDYTVIVLERAAESRRRGLDPRSAAAEALRSTGGTVSSAALVMISVFAVYVILPMLDFKQMGVGLAAAIALDATLVRGIALPAALTLLGEHGLRGDPRARAAGWDHGRHGSILDAGHAG